MTLPADALPAGSDPGCTEMSTPTPLSRPPYPDEEKLARLTKREREVAHTLACGLTNREIAKACGISIKTVDTHRLNIMHKLELHNNVALAHFMIRAGLVTP